MNHRIKINVLLATLFFMLLSFGNVQAQVQKPHYNTYVSSQCNGFYDYLPQGYSATGSTLYPVIIFIHGSWEAGSGSTSDLPKVLKHGPPHVINQGQFPTSFSVNGKSYKFIVFSPQLKSYGSGAATINSVIDYVLQHYKADPNRIYITGLSSGGGTVEDAAADATVGKRLSAAIEFAGTSAPSVTRAANIVANKVAFWGVHNQGDDIVPYTKTTAWVSDVLTVNGVFPTKKTIPNATGHNCWTTRYVPSYTENGLNVYQWMLQYSKTGILPTNAPPVANAGADKSITLPTSSVTLSGSGTDINGSISHYSWTKVSGPSSSTFSTASAASTTVSGLTAGTYVFRLTVTDNGGATGSDDVNVVVRSTVATAMAIPGKVEAENYNTMAGVTAEATTDAGGGQDVGAIDPGNWMSYNVNVKSAGTYTVTFRVATPHSSAKLQLKNSSSTVLATVAVPNTGGYQSWQDVTAKVTLTAGTQTLTVYSSGTDKWNINYMNYASGSTTSTELAANAATKAVAEQGAVVNAVSMAPNPFSERFVLTVNNNYTGTMKVQLIDMSGVVRKEFNIIKGSAGTQQSYLSAGTLTKGTYVVRIQLGEWTKSVQVVKL